MHHEQAQANLQLVLDWIDVAGGAACEGRGQVLAWLRAAPAQPPQVDALELLASKDHAVLGVRNHARQELAGVQLDGQLFTVFTLREGQIVRLRDHAHRADALADAVKGAIIRVTAQAAARWYSWMRPPRRSRRRISPVGDPSRRSSGSGARCSRARCGLSRL